MTDKTDPLVTMVYSITRMSDDLYGEGPMTLDDQDHDLLVVELEHRIEQRDRALAAAKELRSALANFINGDCVVEDVQRAWKVYAATAWLEDR